MSNTDWHSAARDYLARLGRAEYLSAIAAHIKAGRRPNTYRHAPSGYMEALIDCLNRNDEEAFKALKGEQGYASSVGV